MFLWELLFFKYQSDLVTVTPQEDMAQVATFQFAGVYLGMLITGTLGGILAENIGLAACSGIFALAYVILMPLNALYGKQTVAQSGSTG